MKLAVAKTCVALTCALSRLCNTYTSCHLSAPLEPPLSKNVWTRPWYKLVGQCSSSGDRDKTGTHTSVDGSCTPPRCDSLPLGETAFLLDRSPVHRGLPPFELLLLLVQPDDVVC